MSDSSQRSDDKTSDHNRSDKSTSREYLGGCWAEVCENEKKATSDSKRRVSECSQQSDDQPKHILQRHKPLELVKKVEEQTDAVADKKTVLESPPPKSWADCVDQSETQKKVDKEVKESKAEVLDSKKSLESIPEKQAAQAEKVSGNKSDSKSSKDGDERKRSSSGRFETSRDGRTGSQRAERGGYSTFPQRGNRDSRDSRDGNWNRRGGSGTTGSYRTGRYGNQEYYSESDYSEDEGDEGYGRRNGSKSGSRKEAGARGSRSSYYSGQQGLKEGFSPRGEPSRRGRGAATGPGFGRAQATTAPVKSYGPPSSKSPFGSNDEKSEKKDSKETQSDEDRTKQSQKALADGLINKAQKDSAAQKVSGDKLPHSTEAKDERVSFLLNVFKSKIIK